MATRCWRKSLLFVKIILVYSCNLFIKRREVNRNILNVYIPEYFCIDPILLINQDNINICYYPIDKQFKPDLDRLNLLTQKSKPDIFLVVHYFGKPTIINEIKNLCLKFNYGMLKMLLTV